MKLSKLGACVLAGAMLLPLFAGCAGTWTGGELGNDVDLGQNDTSNRSGWVLRERPSADAFADKDLYITYFNGGYGGAWLEEMASTFEEDYPGVQVHLNPTNDVNTTLEVELEESPYDIYISQDIAWEYLGARGLLADLTSELYDSVIYTDTENDNTGIRFRDLLVPASLACSSYQGKYYKVAQIQGAGGIIYNKTMFDQYGWQIPATYEELQELCETIVSAGKVPFLVAGSEGYLWDSLVHDWWIQIAGEEEFSRLYAGKDKDCWNPAVYPYHKQAYQYWYDLFVKNKDRYLYPGFEGLDNLMANSAFLNGLAAMMPATAWAVNELGKDMIEEVGIDVGLIPTPYVKEAKKDENGNFIRVCYDVAGRDSIVVAEKGNKDLAIEFLKWMSETEHTLIFPKNVSGTLMGFKYETETLLAENSPYCKFTWDRDMFKLLGEASFRSTGYSTSYLFIDKKVSDYPLGNKYLDCFTNYGKPSELTVNKIFDDAWNEVNGHWDSWQIV